MNPTFLLRSGGGGLLLFVVFPMLFGAIYGASVGADAETLAETRIDVQAEVDPLVEEALSDTDSQTLVEHAEAGEYETATADARRVYAQTFARDMLTFMIWVLFSTASFVAPVVFENPWLMNWYMLAVYRGIIWGLAAMAFYIPVRKVLIQMGDRYAPNPPR